MFKNDAATKRWWYLAGTSFAKQTAKKPPIKNIICNCNKNVKYFTVNLFIIKCFKTMQLDFVSHDPLTIAIHMRSGHAPGPRGIL